MSQRYRGVSIPWYAYSPHGAETWTTRADHGEGIFQILKGFGVNCIELNYARDLWNYTARYPEYRDRLEAVVQWCEARDIHVILKFQRWTHTSGAYMLGMPKDRAIWKSTLRSVVERFNPYMNVSSEIGNEANRNMGDPWNWHPWSIDCGEFLRQYTDMEIIFPINHWLGQKQFDNDPEKNRCRQFLRDPPTIKKKRFDMHLYCFYGRVPCNDKEAIRQFYIDQDFIALSQQHDCILGEFGVKSGDNFNFLRHSVELCEEYGISWIANHWTTGDIGLAQRGLETPNARGQIIVDLLQQYGPDDAEDGPYVTQQDLQDTLTPIHDRLSDHLRQLEVLQDRDRAQQQEINRIYRILTQLRVALEAS